MADTEDSTIRFNRTVVQARDGVELEVFQFPGGDRVALLLHGFPEHAGCWRHQVQTLNRAGYTVWIPNLRGYGRSSAPLDVSAYAVGELLGDISSLIDASGAESTLLVGHDFGGMLAWLYTLKDESRVDGLIVMGSFHPGMSAGLVGGVQGLRSAYIGMFLWPGLAETTGALLEYSGVMGLISRLGKDDPHSRQIISMYRDNMRHPGRMTAILNYYRAFMNPALWRAEELASIQREISIPVLMINGAEDPFVGEILLQGTEKRVSRLTPIRIPGAGHWVHMRVPGAVNETIDSWITHHEADLAAAGR